MTKVSLSSRPNKWKTGAKDRIDRSTAGEKIQHEMEPKRAEGEVRTSDIRYYPLRDTTGTIIGTVGAMWDVSEHKGRVPDKVLTPIERWLLCSGSASISRSTLCLRVAFGPARLRA